MPASGPPGSEAGTGLPGPIPMPRLVFSLSSALRVPAIVGLGPRRERGNLKAIVEDAKSKLAVSLWQREQVLVHILWKGCSEPASHTDSRGCPSHRRETSVGSVRSHQPAGQEGGPGARDPDSPQMAAGSGQWGLWRGLSHSLCSCRGRKSLSAAAKAPTGSSGQGMPRSPCPQPQVLPGLFWKLLNEARLAPWADVILWERQGQSGHPFQVTCGSSV